VERRVLDVRERESVLMVLKGKIGKGKWEG